MAGPRTTESIAAPERPAARIAFGAVAVTLGAAALGILTLVLWAQTATSAQTPPSPQPTPTPSPTRTPSPTPSPTQTPALPERLGSAWDTFWTDSLLPFAGALAFALGVVLFFFVLARLMVESPIIRRRRSSTAERALLGWTGWLVVITAAVGAVVIGIQLTISSTATNPLWVLLTLAAFGMLGSVALAMWLGARLRLDVSVAAGGETADKKDASVMDRADVITRIRALSVPSSRLLEVPSGMDLAGVATGLGALSDHPLAKAVQGIVLFVIGVVPWKVSVTQLSATEATVQIVRHGRVQAEERLSVAASPHDVAPLRAITSPPPDPPTTAPDAAPGGPETAPSARGAKHSAERGNAKPGRKRRKESETAQRGAAPDRTVIRSAPEPPEPTPTPKPATRDLLATAIAARVVVALRDTETYDVDRALMGATSAPSIGLRTIAATWFLNDRTEAEEILTKAIELDPFNRLAHSTQDWVQSRSCTDPDEIDAFCDRLIARLRDRRSELGLRAAAGDAFYASTLMTLAAMSRNGAAKRPNRARLDTASALLSDWMSLAERSSTNRVRRARAEIDLLALDAARGRARPHERFLADPAVAVTPSLGYSLGCYLVRWADVPFADADAHRLLAAGIRDPQQRDFARTDPELTTARDHAGFEAWLAT